MTGPYHDSTTPLNATNKLKYNVHEKRSKKSKDDEIEKREENMSKKKSEDGLSSFDVCAKAFGYFVTIKDCYSYQLY